MPIYWIKVAPTKRPMPLNLGIGVTAHDEADARTLTRLLVGERAIVSIEIVEDVTSLDQAHVRPNMGNIFARGVWFPLDYEGRTEAAGR
jgi:hypothetical protein